MTSPEPGPELDARVAEALFGYRWWRSSATGRRCIYAPGKNPEWMQTPADGSEPLVFDWSERRWTAAYSTDMAEAWKVVEYLSRDGYSVRLWVWQEGKVTVEAWCPQGPCPRHGHDDPEQGHGVVDVEADTAPHAIALAALKAVDEGGSR